MAHFLIVEPWVFKQFDMMKDRIEDSFDLVLNRHVSIHLGLLDSIQVCWLYRYILFKLTKILNQFR